MINKIKLLILTLLLSSCSSVFYHPSKFIYKVPKNYKNEWITSKDGTLINAWIINQTTDKNPKGVILQFHGNAANMSSYFDSMEWLTKQGYILITFDYRGYGNSAGEPNHKGVHEDAIAILNFSMKYAASNKLSLVVYGQSLGGIILPRAISMIKDKNPIKLVVLDSTFSSFQNIVARKLLEAFITIPLIPFGYLITSDEYASINHLDYNIPTLVIHGAKDMVVSIKHGKKLYKELSGKKYFWEIKDGDHIDMMYRKKYRIKFLKFLKDSI